MKVFTITKEIDYLDSIYNSMIQIYTDEEKAYSDLAALRQVEIDNGEDAFPCITYEIECVHLNEDKVAEMTEADQLTLAKTKLQEIIEVSGYCFADNFRYARIDDLDAIRAYREAKKDGCCGFYDGRTIIHGYEWMIGCNYGH